MYVPYYIQMMSSAGGMGGVVVLGTETPTPSVTTPMKWGITCRLFHSEQTELRMLSAVETHTHVSFWMMVPLSVGEMGSEVSLVMKTPYQKDLSPLKWDRICLSSILVLTEQPQRSLAD
jgi:hypothetical protein